MTLLDDTRTPTPTDEGGGDGPQRVTVNLSAKTVQALATITAATEITKTDAINRSILFYAEIRKLIEDGGAVYIREAGSKELERIRVF